MAMQGEKVDAINAFNELHRRGRENYSELSARIATYDLAYQLHTSAPEALDISSEDEQTRERYGLNLPKGDHALILHTLFQRNVGRKKPPRFIGLKAHFRMDLAVRPHTPNSIGMKVDLVLFRTVPECGRIDERLLFPSRSDVTDLDLSEKLYNPFIIHHILGTPLPVDRCNGWIVFLQLVFSHPETLFDRDTEI